MVKLKKKDLNTNLIQKYKNLGINTNSKAFKRFYKAGLLKNIDKSFVNEVKEYWGQYTRRRIDPVLHIAFYNLTGEKNVKLVPSNHMWNNVIPYLNDMNIRIGYSDKNLYDKLIPTKNIPKTILKCVRGHLFNHNNKLLQDNEVMTLLISQKSDFIIKPSDTDNGQGVAKLTYKDDAFFLKNEKITKIDQLKNKYNFNFIIQEVIKQHTVMSEPHPSSVNTLRMVTLRWNGEINHILTYARFGGGNNVIDHAISGGVSVGVNDDGILNSFALDTHCNKYTHHPTTNYDFSNQITIPNYAKFKSFVEKLHEEILHHDMVSWDIAVGEDEEPIFIEANYRGTSWRYQLVAQKALFGELTDEIMENINKDNKSKSVKPQVPIQFRRKHRRLKRENSKLKKELNKHKKMYKDIISSKSWNITAPLRKIRSFFNK